MKNALLARRLRNIRPVLRCQTAVARPEHPVTLHGAADHRASFRPARRWDEQSFDQPLRYPKRMDCQRQINVDQRVSCVQSFPHRFHAAEPVDDPFVAGDQCRVRTKVLFVRYLSTSGPVLELVDDLERQSGDGRQLTGERRFAAAGVAEYGNSLHAGGRRGIKAAWRGSGLRSWHLWMDDSCDRNSSMRSCRLET